MEELKHISFLSREIERLHISDYVICKILFEKGILDEEDLKQIQQDVENLLQKINEELEMEGLGVDD